MNDPNKERFIRETLIRIRTLRKEIVDAQKDNKEISEVMGKIQEEIQLIKDQASETFESSSPSMSPEELQAFIQNPSNFSEEDWRLLEDIKSETEATKREIVKANEDEVVKDILGNQKKKQEKEKDQRDEETGTKLYLKGLRYKTFLTPAKKV